MAQYAQKVFGQWQLITGSFMTGDGDDALQHPANWPELNEQADREAAGVYEVAELPDQPQNVKILGTKVVDSLFGPAMVWDYIDYTLDEAKFLWLAAAESYRDAKLKQITPDTLTRYTPSAYIDACYIAWLAVRTAVNDIVTDADDIFAIDLTAGYPQ
jgi:hypothetical protein